MRLSFLRQTFHRVYLEAAVESKSEKVTYPPVFEVAESEKSLRSLASAVLREKCATFGLFMAFQGHFGHYAAGRGQKVKIRVKIFNFFGIDPAPPKITWRVVLATFRRVFMPFTPRYEMCILGRHPELKGLQRRARLRIV